MQRQQQELGVRLMRYGLAVGSGGLVAAAAQADGIPFEPAGGLPITIDSSVTDANPLEIDFDGDMVVDFNVFYQLRYGGGFAIQPVNPGTGGGVPRVQLAYSNNCVGTPRVNRHDADEFIRPDNDTGFYPDFSSQTFPPAYIDHEFEPDTYCVAGYAPFRDNPGFIGLALGRSSPEPITPLSVGFAATLELVVNSDGSELTILGGEYRQDDFDLRLDRGVVYQDGLEDPATSAYFPAPALKALATGAQD